LPSSLTTVLPIALVFSTCPPVSVMGYGRCASCLAAFLGSMGSVTSPEAARYHVSVLMGPGLTWSPTYTLTPGQPSPGLTYPTASPHRLPPQGGSVRPEGQPLSNLELAWARAQRYRNINRLCIDYACRPRLSSRLTLGGLAFPRNPWTFGGGVSHPSFATHTCILTRPRSTPVHTVASLRGRRSPTAPTCVEARGFGSELEPRYIVRAGPLDQ
jgi:hypothetical protein